MMNVSRCSRLIRVLAVLVPWLANAIIFAAETEGMRIGAIRWDGWYGSGGVVKAVEASLGQPKYHFRLPWFAEVKADGTVRINGDAQAIMEQEIAYAAHAGLNYWAFVDYLDEAPDLSIALNRFLAAPDKRGLRYCLVEEGHRLDQAGVEAWAPILRHFQHPDYQTVLDDRPLLYVFLPTTKLHRAEWDELRRRTVAAGRKSPYLVLMGFRPEQDAKAMADLGFDAVSAYARGGSYSMTQPAYAEQCAMIRRDRWEKWRALGVPSVTFASAGWDTRPRNERPPPWMRDEVKAEPDPTPPAQQKPLLDAVTATPEELARHVVEAVQWAASHRELNPANTVIVYAWNEHDEGGWLQPTRGADGTPDDSRVQALRKVLHPLQATPQAKGQSPSHPKP